MNAGIIALIVILVLMGLIVLAVILLKRHVSAFKNDDKPKSDKEIAQEELDRILEPIDELQPVGENEEEEKQEEDIIEEQEDKKDDQ